MDNEAKMQITKQAMSEGYKGNFTDLIIQQEEAMQKQNQSSIHLFQLRLESERFVLDPLAHPL